MTLKRTRSLQIANLKLMPNEMCEEMSQKFNKTPFFLTNYEICAYPGHQDTCSGDSGGPLICPSRSGNAVLHGVTSWGFGCAQAHLPGGSYASVYAMLDFIKVFNGFSDF